MTAITSDHTVGQLVAERPSRARVFESLGIDYCCGGKRTLDQACDSKGLDAVTVLRTMLAAETESPPPDADWTAASLTALCDHIEDTHHRYLRGELPRLGVMIDKVVTAHADKDRRLLDLARTFDGLVNELSSHMMKEEQVLFPMVRELEASDTPPSFHCGTLRNPIAVMEHEHDAAGAALADMRALTDGYVPPAEACNTWRAMLDGLEQLEADMHRHVHKENNILFPRAIRLEAQRQGAAA